MRKELAALLTALCMLLNCLPALAGEEEMLTLPADGVLTIDHAGVFRVSGTTAQGCIVITAPKKAQVTLILDGVEVTNADGPALMSENSIGLTLETAAGTQNRLVSGVPVDVLTAASAEEAEGGAIRVKGDLTMDGTGSLTVGGYVNNGVQASAGVMILGGTLTVEAVHTGVRGKEGVAVKGGALTVTSGGDGLAATDEEKGAVSVTGGTVLIRSGGDAVQARTELTVEDGTLTVTAGSGSAAVTMTGGDDWGRGGFGWSGRQDGMGGRGGRGGFGRTNDGTTGEREQAAGGMTPPDGLQFPGGMTPTDGMPVPGTDNGDDAEGAAPAFAAEAASPAMTPDATVSRKGLKCGGTLRVSGGVMTIDSEDDALHAADVTVTGGTMTLSSGDDGVHADKALSISGGRVTVAYSNEGLEGLTIRVSGGDISVTSVDDGINAGDGSGKDGYGFDRRGGRATENAAQSGEKPLLQITGGTVYVNAGGDGLDSNGDLLVEGGMVIVDGPTDSGNGALDAGTESGGTCLVNGGTVLAIGAAGMAESFNAASGQGFITTNVNIPAGAQIVVTKADGTELMRHTAARAAGHLVFSCGGIAEGEVLTVTVDGTATQVTVDRNGGGSSFGFGNRGRW